MADNQYRKYLEEQQNSQPHDSVLGNMLGLGAAVGGAALAYRFRGHIAEGLKIAGHAVGGAVFGSAADIVGSRTLTRATNLAGSYLKAVDHAMEGAGPLSFLTSRGRARFDSRFERSLNRSFDDMIKRARTAEAPIGHTPLKIEQSMYQARIQAKTAQSVQASGFLYNKIIDELGSHPDINNDMWKNLTNILNNQRDEFFRQPNEERVESLLKEYTKPKDGKDTFQHALEFTDEIQREKVKRALTDTLKRNRSERSLSSEERKELQNRQRGIANLTYDKLREGAEKKDNWFTKMLSNVGWDQVTIKDSLDHGLIQNDSIRIPGKAGQYRNRMSADRIKKIAEADKRFLRLVADPLVFINRNTGDIADFRGASKGLWNTLSTFRDTTQVPYLKFNILDLLHFTTAEGVKDAPYMYMFRRGTIDPLLGATKGIHTLEHPMAHNQDAAVGPLARDYMYMNNSVYDLTTLKKVKDDVYLASARFGMIPRALAGMSNLHKVDYRTRKGFLGGLLNLFDINGQETQSIFGRTKSVITKLDDPSWERNQMARLRQVQRTGEYNYEELNGIYRNLFSKIESKTKSLSDDAADYLNEHVKGAYGNLGIDLTKLNTDEEIISAFGRIHNALSNKGGNILRDDGLSKQFDKIWRQMKQNPYEYLKGKRVRSDGMLDLPENVSFLDPHQTDLISAAEDAKRLIQQHALRQVAYSQGTSVSEIVRQGIEEGTLSRKHLKEVRHLESLTSMRQWWSDVYENPAGKNDALKEFANFVGDSNKSMSKAVDETINDFSPIYEVGPGDKPPQPFGYVGFMTVNKTRGWKSALENYNSQILSGKNPLKAGVGAALNIIGQPFAGRKNMENVSTLSLMSYYMAERMDNAFAKIGLGLSQRNRGSFQSILGNQFLRRVVLPYAALQQLHYFDDMTNDTVSDTAANMYVNMHQDVAGMKELFGINGVIKQAKKIFAGSDQIGELPGAKAFNFLTFDLFSGDRSADEDKQYWESGEDPIRKGRWWGMGSNTPWMGGKIDRWEPNWYRKLKSDYEYTDTLYGSADEYWANSLVPTLTHPFAPIKHFLDPMHFQKKHMDDRPYPVYGGIPDLDMVPIVGPALNATVGRIISPTFYHPGLAKAHRQYIEEINQNIENQYAMASGTGVIQYMPAGGTNISYGKLVGSPTIGSSDSDGTGDLQFVAADQGGGAGVIAGGGNGAGDSGYGYGSGLMGSGSGRAAGSMQAALTAMNISLTDQGGPSLGAGGATLRSISSLNDLRDPDIVADLNDIGTMYNASGVLRDSVYSSTELAGIYGFGTKSIFGWDESGRGMTLDNANRMTSYTRAWWDNELGSMDGVGGGFSEIFRRYIPRDPNKNYWNPIRNTMPDWLPGVNYFTDFQHGDPYTKIAHGEMRLPGKAYEKLYKLHPDALGQYGAFDRFRILADVAPYSENYKFYRQIVSQLNKNGMLDDKEKQEFAEIRDQVSQKKKKYHFYNKRFKHADLQYKKVTVTDVIDSNTFLTKEYGWDNPIRLAGVAVRADDEESNALIKQYIHTGAQLTIGIDADPMVRERDDMFNTMRAVVYTSHNEEGMPWFMNNKGQNLNYMLANRSYGGFLGMGIGGHNKVRIKDDESATSTAALFSQDQITVGKIWETMMHDVAPNLPILGPFFDKFLQVRSPLEQYKRELYGKAWRPWTDPIHGWIEPMLDTIRERNPILAAAEGAGIGYLATRKKGNKWGVLIGGLVGGGLSALRVFGETAHSLTGGDDTWIPERREKEREINDYFDRIKYIKYKGLYDKASELAKKREGIDVDSLLSDSKDRGKKNKGAKRFLEAQKKYLAISKKIGYGDEEAIKERLDKVRSDIKTIESDKTMGELGPNTMLALRYRAEYESTLYGADENGDMTKIFRALPNNDREFFTEFMNAAPEEREEILRLVPKNEKRFFQAKWGLKTDEPESLRSYFRTHYLPDEKWVGWQANTSLDAIKLKVVKNEALEMTDFGFWQDDVKRAEQAGAKAIPMNRLSQNIDVTRLEKVLRGAGLHDVSVSMSTNQSDNDESKVTVAMNMLKDRTNELAAQINANISSIFS